MLRLLVILCVLMSCSTKPTKYQAYKKKKGGGYQEQLLGENLWLVSFKGNEKSKVSTSTSYAKFRAIEICRKENMKFAHILDSLDKTKRKTVTRTSSTGFPSYYYGMSPFYNRYSGFGYGFGFSSTNSSSWDETLKYPRIDVFFECANEVYGPEINLREVMGEEMKHLVKDLKGGLQVESIPAGSPNEGKIQVGDIIIRGQGKRIELAYLLSAMFGKARDHKIKVDVLRNGAIKSTVMKGVSITPAVDKEQKEVIKKVCKHEEVKKNELCKI